MVLAFPISASGAFLRLPFYLVYDRACSEFTHPIRADSAPVRLGKNVKGYQKSMKSKQYWMGFVIALLAGTVATLQATGMVSGDVWLYLLAALLLGLAWFYWTRAKAASKKGMDAGAVVKGVVAVFMTVFALLCIPPLHALASVQLYVSIAAALFVLEGVQWIATLVTPQKHSSGGNRWSIDNVVLVFLVVVCGLAIIVSSVLSLIAVFGGVLSEAYVLWLLPVCLFSIAGFMLIPLFIHIRGQQNVRKISRDIISRRSS